MSNEPSESEERERSATSGGTETIESANGSAKAETAVESDTPEEGGETESETAGKQTVDREGVANQEFERVASSPATRGEAQLSTDLLFELHSAPGNRFVLTYLLRRENPATYSDLVEYVVERTETPADVSEGKYQGRIAARLVHCNLPKLADAGLVEHDPEEKVVSATGAIQDVAPYLALAMSQSTVDDGLA